MPQSKTIPLGIWMVNQSSAGTQVRHGGDKLDRVRSGFLSSKFTPVIILTFAGWGYNSGTTFPRNGGKTHGKRYF